MVAKVQSAAGLPQIQDAQEEKGNIMERIQGQATDLKKVERVADKLYTAAQAKLSTCSSRFRSVFDELSDAMELCGRHLSMLQHAARFSKTLAGDAITKDIAQDFFVFLCV